MKERKENQYPHGQQQHHHNGEKKSCGGCCDKGGNKEGCSNKGDHPAQNNQWSHSDRPSKDGHNHKR